MLGALVRGGDLLPRQDPALGLAQGLQKEPSNLQEPCLPDPRSHTCASQVRPPCTCSLEGPMTLRGHLLRAPEVRDGCPFPGASSQAG